MVVLYTNHCPLCNALKDALNDKNVSYIEETDENKMLSLGIDRTPMLSVPNSEKLLNYKEALQWLREKG